MSSFGTLNTAYSGLSSAQRGVDTTSHNIANAENKDYTRQRVTQETLPSKSVADTVVGTGTSIATIERVHNEFVFTRYQQSSERMEYSNSLKQNLEEISSYFPDMDGVGIKNDLENYFRSWSSLAQEPSNLAFKEVLATNSENLATSIKTSFNQMENIQKSINGEIEAQIKEVNATLKDIANLNKSIDAQEVRGGTANDLRDKRDALETKLAKLVGAEFVHGNISESGSEPTIAEAEGLYSALVGGVALVTGTTYREITMDSKSSKDGFITLNIKGSRGDLTDITNIVQKGRVGAMLELRGREFDENREPKDGIITEFKDKLDTFAKGLIQYTNSIYSESASENMRSNTLGGVKESSNLLEKTDVRVGNFDVVIYDKNGDEVGKRSVYIDETTTFGSVLEQLNTSYDDNGDGSLNNDFASNFEAFISNDRLSIKSKGDYTFGIEDNDTNFAGAIGMNSFFLGKGASDISLNRELSREPNDISGFKAPNDGDNGVANSMSRLEVESWKFGDRDETVLGAYNTFAVDLASKTEAIVLRQETIQVQFNAIETELNTISKVSIDDELVNLMKYQTAYAASGKVISTLDRMIDTLLGLKQ
jgi:flagellar hook-associated protein 1 FlgK